MRLNVRGGLATSLTSELRSAWSWCVDLPAETVPAVALDVFIDPDPGRVTASGTSYAGTDVASMMHGLSPLITAEAVAARAGQLLMFHAGAVADPASGRTVGLVAPSGTGKTTAVTALGQAFAYVTDETLAIDAERRVIPYPKPLSVLRPESHPLKVQMSPSAVGLMRPRVPLVLGVLALLCRDPAGPDEPIVEIVSTIPALTALSPETSSLGRLPRPLHLLADLLASTGGLRRVHYREAESLGAVVEDLLEGSR